MRATLVFSTLVFAACGIDPTDGSIVNMTVIGHVTTSSGSPVSGAAIRIEVRTESCAPWMNPVIVSTDANGDYSGTVFQWGEAFTGCLQVSATKSGITADSARRAPVGFGPADTVRIDMVVAPSA